MRVLKNSDTSVKKAGTDKSIKMSRSKIDRDGVAWSRRSLFCRQEHLGKLKVIAHFEGTTIENLIDRALDQYISRNFDKTTARRQLVEKSQAKSEKIPV